MSRKFRQQKKALKRKVLLKENLHVKESELDAMKDKAQRHAENKYRHFERLQGSRKGCSNLQGDGTGDEKQALRKQLDETQNVYNASKLTGMYGYF